MVDGGFVRATACHDYLRYSGTDELLKKLEGELELRRKQALFETATANAELSTRRQSQYEVLSQLQVHNACR